MNKQTILGFVLIAAILFGFTWWNGKQQQKAQEAQRITDSIARANAPAPVEPLAPVPDSARMALTAGLAGAAPAAQADPLGGTLAAARGGEEQTITVANDLATYRFSTLGGALSDVVLKNYDKYGGGPLHTREFNFIPQGDPSTEWAEGETEKKISMILPVDSVARIEFIYTIPRADYMIGLEVRLAGMEGRLSKQSSFEIDWANTSLQNEKGFDNENNYTTVAYHYPGVKSVEQLGIQRAGGSKTESESSRVKWVAFKQHFFSSILVADDAFAGADMDMATSQPGEGTIKKFHTKVSVPMERGREAYNLGFYLGPNEFSTLKSYDLSMERMISMGFMSFGWVTRILVIPVFDWLGGRIASFGLIILILALLVKIIIFPLTLPSYKSSAKMRIIKPEVDEINARYPDQADAMKKQQATMELYRRAGINPLAGCLPMLIQMPIIIAVFRFFPAAIELRGQRLWWAEDLSSYDSVLDLGFKIPWYGDHVSLFALLMAVAMFFYSWLSMKQQSGQPQMAGMKFMMLYLMPAMMLLWFNNMSSGLCYYYFLGNILTIAQIYGVRFFVNEDKLRKKMLETPRKEKKKSGFMQRLEEAQKAQMAAAAAQAKARGGDVPPPVRGSRGNLPGSSGKKRR
jgi:YidC/Oxa1 family membrane protein insertase